MVKDILNTFAPALGFALALAGCGNEVPRPKPSERAEVTVALPPAPTLTKRSYEKLAGDGSYTVEGLLRERDKLLGESVSVRGVVKKIQKCPEPPPPPPPVVDADAKGGDVVPPPPPPRRPRTCNPPPHFFLVDKNPSSKRELLVYGSMWSVLPNLEDGQEVTLAGSFDIVSKDGVFLRQAGLVVLDDLPEAPPAAGDAVP
jgi:hypothetical protein